MAIGFGKGEGSEGAGAGGDQDTPDNTPHRPQLPYLQQIMQYPFQSHPTAEDVAEQSREILLQFTTQEIDLREDAEELKERFPLYINHLETASTEAVSGDSNPCAEAAGTEESPVVRRNVQSDSDPSTRRVPQLGGFQGQGACSSPVEHSTPVAVPRTNDSHL